MRTPRRSESSVLWCTPFDELRTLDQEERFGDQRPLCTDLNVAIDHIGRSISVDLEGHGLAEFVTGRSHCDGPYGVALADELDDALRVVADHLDRMCGIVLVRDR